MNKNKSSMHITICEKSPKFDKNKNQFCLFQQNKIIFSRKYNKNTDLLLSRKH